MEKKEKALVALRLPGDSRYLWEYPRGLVALEEFLATLSSRGPIGQAMIYMVELGLLPGAVRKIGKRTTKDLITWHNVDLEIEMSADNPEGKGGEHIITFRRKGKTGKQNIKRN